MPPRRPRLRQSGPGGLRTTKAPDRRGPWCWSGSDRLFQRGIDRREGGVQLAAKAVDDRDDGQRNAGRDQSIFDRGGAGLILRETRKKGLHWVLHVYTWLRTSGWSYRRSQHRDHAATLKPENCSAVNS